MRYRFVTAFHGGQFHGWQRQPGLRTVQGELELWLGRLLGTGHVVEVTGAGRTDAGVHAHCLPAHFDSDLTIPCAELEHRLRAALSDDLTVTGLRPAAEGFHARFSAIARTYEYRIRTAPWPFDCDREWRLHRPFDLALLNDAASRIVGPHDFGGFCRLEAARKDSRCHVSAATWRREGDLWTFEIRANRFIHEMVRLLVGTMVDIGRGRYGPGRMDDILATRDVPLCGDAAPAQGLTLREVEYPAAHS